MAAEKPAAKKEEAKSWYGWQTLAVDAVAVGAMIMSVSAAPSASEGAAALVLPAHLLDADERPDATAAVGASLALYTLRPAFVHAAHGRGAQALASPAIRALAPAVGTFAGLCYGLVGAVIVSSLDGSRSSRGISEAGVSTLVAGVASGYAIGFLAPIAIDAGLFGYEPVETEPKTKEQEAREGQEEAAKSRWSPRVAWSTYGPNVGISGTF